MVEDPTLDLPGTITRLVALGDPHGDLAGLEGALAREAGPATAFVSMGDNVGYADGPTSSRLVARLVELGIPSVRGNHEDWLDGDGALAITSARGPARRLTREAFAWCRALPLRLRVRFAAAPELTVRLAHTLLDPGPDQRWGFLSPTNVEAFASNEGADLLLTGHSHGPGVWRVPRDRHGPITLARLDLDGDAPLLEPLEPGVRRVVDAGSLGRPNHFPLPGRFDRATYAVVDVARRRVEVHVFTKTVVPPA